MNLRNKKLTRALIQFHLGPAIRPENRVYDWANAELLHIVSIKGELIFGISCGQVLCIIYASVSWEGQ